MDVTAASRDLSRLRAEITQIENDLVEKKEQAIKIAHFIEMAEVYLDRSVSGDISKSVPKQSEYGVVSSKRNARDPANEIEFKRNEPPRNVRVTINILRDRGRPMKTKELITELEARGITIGGKTPVTNLSSALSRFKTLLKADRSEGWSLIEEPKVDDHQAPIADIAA